MVVEGESVFVKLKTVEVVSGTREGDSSPGFTDECKKSRDVSVAFEFKHSP
jgi:hypothetical protein